jgi:hypothetical protein
MDRTTRWETEALRSAPQSKKSPPQPSRKRETSVREWVTLREAEAATGIPANTLRKWVRKDELASYLESDGDMALRMVDLNDVKRRATSLGRAITPKDIEPPQESAEPLQESADDEAIHQPDTGEPDAPVGTVPPGTVPQEAMPQVTIPQEAMPQETLPQETMPPDTMIVPIDAWNKMLNQLGNLHEAGQQLAEARERAAKAETEAVFLRDRLAELRVESPTVVASEPEVEESEVSTPAEQSTSYWRYLTTGWRNRSK